MEESATGSAGWTRLFQRGLQRALCYGRRQRMASRDRGVVLWKGSFLVPAFDRSHLPSHPSPTHGHQWANCLVQEYNSLPVSSNSQRRKRKHHRGRPCRAATSVFMVHLMEQRRKSHFPLLTPGGGSYWTFVLYSDLDTSIFNTPRATNLPSRVLEAAAALWTFTETQH